jgi:hypothetical protein
LRRSQDRLGWIECRKNVPYLRDSVAEHRADRLQLEVVVRAVGEALVGRRDGLEELSFLRVRHGLVFQDDVVELAEAGRGRVACVESNFGRPAASTRRRPRNNLTHCLFSTQRGAFQGQRVDQPRHFCEIIGLDGLPERLDE